MNAGRKGTKSIVVGGPLFLCACGKHSRWKEQGIQVEDTLVKLCISLALFALLATLVGNLLAQGSAMSDDHNMMLTKPALAEDGVVAWDDFEMDSRSGGAGWLSEWDGGSVTHYDAPHQGIYHLRFATYGGKSSIKRSVDLSGESDLSLQFWLKADGLGGDRYVECRVSPDGETWYPVKAWTDSQPYRFQEVDLSPYPMTSEFFIQFILDGAGAYVNSHVWIDDIRVVHGTSAPPPTPTVPSAAADLSGSSVSSTEIRLIWRDNSNNEDGFKIERRLGSTGNWSQIATVGANVVTCNDAGLSPETTYQYRVRAYSEAGNSDYSNSVSVTTGEAPPSPPPQSFNQGPELLTPENSGTNVDRSPTLSWTSFPGATVYELILARSESFDWIVLKTHTMDAYLDDLDLDYATTYFWRVRVFNPTRSDWSATFSFQTQAAPAATPPTQAPSSPPAPATSPLSSPDMLQPAIWAILGVSTIVLVIYLPLNSRRKRLAREAKVVKEYEDKLMQWEREGYNVSHLREKWFSTK